MKENYQITLSSRNKKYNRRAKVHTYLLVEQKFANWKKINKQMNINSKN